MAMTEFSTARGGLETRLEAAHNRLAAALSRLTAEQAHKGTEWSVVDCLNHLAPRDGGYSNLVETLLGQEHPARGAFSPEQRWDTVKENLGREYQRCRSILARVTPEQWDRPVAQSDGSTRPVSYYVGFMVSHFEEHASQTLDQIIPRLR
ncbi:MAG: DinB family protein [Chloroflexi bacterium]|nr:DinB family protein [Chloroflexota bacterium]